MKSRWICLIAAVFVAAVSSDSRAQQPHSMAGMKGMKDSVPKVKPASRKKPAAKKKSVKPRRPSSSTRTMKTSPPRTHDSSMKMPVSAVRKHDSSMSMPMTDSAGHMKHDSAGMRMRDSMPSMPSVSPHGDSAHAMNKTDSARTRNSSTMPMTMHTGKSDSMQMGGMRPMTAADMMVGPVGISMERMGSGTTWIPDAVTMPSRARMFGKWMVMAHGFAYAQYNHQSGKRGDDQFGSLNWAMLMATRNVAGGRFQARTMLSLDALTVTSRGYPLLLQTGEAFDGAPLHDRQHPHDFWMELGALYQRQLTPKIGWSLYAAPSGEPALGPVAFMHRPSAMDNPTAPLSHHWQDATHVSFGVVTGGLFTKTLQVEASAFNGREPDQSRWNIEPIKIDSYSSRITFNPTAAWSFSGGFGYLKSPEILNPEESMHRMTASILHGRKVGLDGQIASAVIWGANRHSGHAEWSHSVLGESEAILDRSNTIFARAEWIQKSAEDLVLETGSAGALPPGTPTFPAEQIFNVSAFQAGYIREILRTRWATLGLGGSATVNFVPSSLEPAYGSRTPFGALVFFRLRPFHERAGRGGGMEKHNHE